MTVSLTPPVRIAAFVGALVLTGLAAIVFLVARGSVGDDASGQAGSITSAKPVPAQVAPKPAPKAAVRPKPRVASGFPPRIDHALRYSRVVVVSVSVPRAAVDAVLRREARAAAKTAGVGFVAISASNERAVSALIAKTGVLPAPAVVVVKRPGVVTSIFPLTDATTIQQAVAQARRR